MSSSSFLLLLLLLPLLLAVLSRIHKRRSRRRRRLPPGPPGLPIVGNLHQLMGPLPHHSLRRLSASHGPLMLLQLGQVPALVVSSPAGARDVLRTHDLSLCSRPRLAAWQKLSYGGLDLAFAPYSDHWVRMRKLATVEFFSAKRTLLLRPTREEEVRTLVHNISRAGDAAAVNLSEMFLCLLSNVTCRALFGNRYAPEGECARSTLAGMISESIELMGGFVAGDFFPSVQYLLNVITRVQRKLEKNFKEMDEFLEREVEEKARKRKADRERGDGEGDPDFASVLVRLHEDESIGLTRDAMKAILMVLFIAGTVTIAAAMVWTMAELMRKSRALAKAQEEVQRFARVEKKDYVQEKDLHHLRYLSAVVKEALRLHPPGPLLLPRESREDCQIAGYDIPAGTRVYINAWAIGRDPGAWESPDEFRPERFEEDGSVDYKAQDFELVSFGGGRRMCPGMSIATTTMELCLANLLLKFRWELPEGMRGDDIDMGEAFGVVVTKKVPLVLVATPIPTM